MSTLAHVESNWAAGTCSITVVRGGQDSRAVMRLDEARGWTWESYDPLSTVEPTLVVPSEVLEAIVAAAGDVLPPSAATGQHLKDSVAVRDRLLTLVERLAGGGPS